MTPNESPAQGYFQSYIRAALKDDTLAAPDKAQADGNYETLFTLYDAHQRGGQTAAREAWDTIKRFRPALAEYDPDTPIASYKPDDDMIATELAKEKRDQVAYFRDAWRIYEGGCWRLQESSEFRHYIRRELRSFRVRGVQVSQTRVKALASMLEDDLIVPNRTILERQKGQTKYINLRNGLFNLEASQLEDHRADLFFTTQHDFDYDPHATVNHFIKYLNSSLVLPNGKTDYQLVTLVLEALAYSMTARTDLKASFWLVGAKDSGKSTFIALIKALMGELHATIDLTQLGTNRFLLSGIVGKRVITFTEASSSTILPDALYKTLIGGTDEVYADVKNKDGFSFRPEAKVWWAMNEMPRVSDRSGATTRRIVIIPFNRTIPESERIPDLEWKLMSERSGIFNLLMDHLKEVQKRGGFTSCEQSERLHEEYVRENDTEATYLEERAEQHESYRIQSSILYNDYKFWCEERGFKPKNYNQVAKDWRRFNFTNKKSDGVMIWEGLRLRESLKK